jgi:hypothetical protein
MKTISTIILPLILGSTLAISTERSVVLEETFDHPLSADWHWGLGTWSAKDGVLRGFESGERRHGPVKMIGVSFWPRFPSSRALCRRRAP